MAFMYVCVCMCVKKAYNAKFNLTLSDMPI